MQNQKIVVKSTLIVFTFAAGIFLAGCITDNTSTTAVSTPQVSAPNDSGIFYGLGTAYDLQKDVATVTRLSHPNSAAVGFSPQVPAPLSVVGWSSSPSPAGNNSTHTVKV